MRFQTQHNGYRHPDLKKDFSGPSLTMPDQTMTVQEIMRRHSNQSVVYGKEPVYYGEEGSPMQDFAKLDLAEQQEIMQQNLQLLKQKRAELQEQEDLYNAAKRQREIDEAVKKIHARKNSKEEKEDENEEV